MNYVSLMCAMMIYHAVKRTAQTHSAVVSGEYLLQWFALYLPVYRLCAVRLTYNTQCRI
jgi:hypothetical protein